jgi:hypothetical protein
MKRLLLVLCLAIAPAARAVDVSVQFGVLEVVLVPSVSHAGLYPNVGLGFGFPLGHRLTLLTGVALEVSPDQGRGGLVVTGTLDWQVAEHLGLDLNVAAIHDQPGLKFASSEFFLGAGPGVSVLLGRWTLSPFLSLFHGVNVPGFSLVPGLNVAYVFS